MMLVTLRATVDEDECCTLSGLLETGKFIIIIIQSLNPVAYRCNVYIPE